MTVTLESVSPAPPVGTVLVKVINPARLLGILLAVAAFTQIQEWPSEGHVGRVELVLKIIAAGWLLAVPPVTTASKFAHATIAFSLAAGSIWKWSTGAATCGCFGHMEVAPWMTATVAASVGAAYLFQAFTSRPSQMASTWRNSVGQSLQLVAMTVASLLLLHIGWLHLDRIHTAASVEISADPVDWPGLKFPLADHLNCNAPIDLKRGDWIVLLVRSGCGKCNETKQRMLGGRRKEAGHGVPLAIIDLSPSESPTAEQARSPSAISHCTLMWSNAWRIPTPLVVRISEGVVISAQTN